MQATYEQALELKAFCAYFLQPERITTMGEMKKLWLELMERITAKSLKQYGLNVQAFLRWKLAGLEFGESTGMQMLGNADSGK